MLAYILLIIIGLFAAILALKHVLSLKVCVLCGSIFLTWASLLALQKTGRFHDEVLLSLLMGQSVTGVYYLLDRRVKPALKIFTLPFFLSLTTLFYLIITGKTLIAPLLVLLGLWAIAYIIFAWRNDPAKRRVANAVMECCKDN